LWKNRRKFTCVTAIPIYSSNFLIIATNAIQAMEKRGTLTVNTEKEMICKITFKVLGRYKPEDIHEYRSFFTTKKWEKYRAWSECI
jgi:hypothetical protein